MANPAPRRVMCPAAPSLALLSALAATAAACGRPTTEIVLVVDTDLAVPAEIDRVEIALFGPSGPAAPIGIDLTSPSTPPFPMTLGLTPAGEPTAVTIRAVGLHQGALSVAEELRTAFVGGEVRMARIVLSATCLGITCGDGETCSAGRCQPVDRPGGELPGWPGEPPGRPDGRATLIAGRSLWSGGWFSCATKGGPLFCWGQNSDGQLGNGQVGEDRVTRSPIVDLPHPAASVGLGYLHGCICDDTGQAWCWGRNAEGQLGVGDLQPHIRPTAVPGLSDCVQITGGGAHTCAIRTSGGVVCWGRNADGQVGQAPSATPVTTPQPVADLSNGVVEVRAGDRFTCARRTNNAVYCWGDDNRGQLGDGAAVSHGPVRVLTLPSGAAELATGRLSACVRYASGRVACWGENSDGMLGGAANPTPAPVDIPGIDDAVQIASGHQHACVLRKSGVVSCWGGNQYGQLGDGQGASSAVPVDVVDIAGATSIVTGVVHSCARHAAGLSCWGQNIVGQLGDGTNAGNMRPSAVIGF